MKGRQLLLPLAVLGLVLIVVTLPSAFSDPHAFFRSYLFSYLFWIDLPLGALPMLMIYRLTGGAWGAAVRKVMEAMAATLWLFAPLFIPLIVWMDKIYPWLDPNVMSDPRNQHKHLYLNPTSFTLRAIFYFACWLIMAFFLQRLSRRQEENPTTETDAKIRSLSAGGLVLFSMTITFACVDWQMSVEPTWYSTIYGMVYGAGQALQAFAVALVAFALAAKATRGLSDQFSRKSLWDMGNILLTLVVLWTYLSFMQYLIVWSGNLPHEAIWFTHRSQGGWQSIALLLAVFQFGAPFGFLLFRSMKGKPSRLLVMGLWLFAIRIFDHYWMLMPGFYPGKIAFPWQSALLWLGIGALWVSLFTKRYLSAPWFAVGDPDWSLAIQQAPEAESSA